MRLDFFQSCKGLDKNISVFRPDSEHRYWYEKFYYVYRIVCTTNKKSYIGVTGNLPTRIFDHYCALNHNRHKNQDMQNDFNRFGADAFEVEILDAAYYREQSSKEKEWQKEYRSYIPEFGYNTIDGHWYRKGKLICQE